MNIQDIKALRAKAHSLEPILQIGKGGITASVLKEINFQLKKKKLIKIKLLKAAGDRKKLVEEIVSGTKAVLVRSVGRVVVLYKR
ncbi:ribosome assembly RNA-binding protein YhbY [Candidatus Woesearchaeota archaeon]|nr:ribosome assembly RNA-binding protein YhbY [Candidatus Woesearchaeota archaeon]